MTALANRTGRRVLNWFYLLVFVTLILSHALILVKYDTAFTILVAACVATFIWMTYLGSRSHDSELLKLIQTFSGIAAILIAGLGCLCVLCETAMETSMVIWCEAFVLALLSVFAPYFCKSVGNLLADFNPTGAAVSVVSLFTVYSSGASTFWVTLALVPFIAAVGFIAAIRSKFGVH